MTEFIPKKPIRKEIPWDKISFYFLVFVLVCSIAVYATLIYLGKNSLKELQKTRDELSQVKTLETTLLEKEIFSEQKRIKDFPILLKEHIYSSKIFKFLEEKSHPQIVFSEFDLNTNTTKLILSGKCDNFYILSQQMAVFREEPMINSLKLSNMSLNEKGEVEFTINISLNEGLFKL